MEHTLSIIKPDSIEKNQIGNILSRLEKGGLKVIASKMICLTKEEAQRFYAIHKDKPFFDELTDFMSSGPILVMVLQGEIAISKNREIMGATDPKAAKIGTIRHDFGTSISNNAIHGSDSLENAKIEIAFFFQEDEIFSR